MDTWTHVRLEVLKKLKAAIGKSYAPTFEELERPPRPEFGDVAFPCFTLAKGLGRNPSEIATELAARISPSGVIKSVTARGPYVNILLDPAVFGARVVEEILAHEDDYGHSTLGAGRRVMVEYANFNTHKEVHIGHVRNMVVGNVVVNILRATGHTVIPVSYLNDLGNNVAKCLWAVKKFHEHEEPAEGDEINFLGRVYTEATKAAEQDEAAREEISDIQRALEQGRGEWLTLWKKTRQWSLDAIFRVYKEMKIPIEVQYYESDLLSETKQIVQSLRDQGLAVDSQGAVIVDLEEEGLGANLLLKSDGTHLYNAKDLALAMQKSRDYDLDRSLIVVDVRQSLAMRQLFATLKRMQVAIPYEHVSYGFVTLPEGAMSSRKGNIVRYEALRDALLAAAEQETVERHGDWSQKQVEQVAAGIARAAMIYGMARQDASRDMVFDLNEAVAFEGQSGPYLLYTSTRIQSVLEKADVRPAVGPEAFATPEAVELVRILARFPQVVQESASSLALAMVPQYAFELAQQFSTYYAACRISDPDDAQGTASRLALVRAVQVTLHRALALLNIEPLTRM